MLDKKRIDEIVSNYKNFKIATICSHSSLQIFKGAREEGIKTIGIVQKDKRKLYESFPLGRPDEFVEVDSYDDIPFDDLVAKQAIIIPHGSFVEYVGQKFDDLKIPIYGNRQSIIWERSRDKMYKWLTKAGIKTPRTYEPDEIDGPAMVKFPGAKGGRGYMIVGSEAEFKKKVGNKDCVIQEFIVGVRAYPHFFFTPFGKQGYQTGHGRIEMLGVDRRVESSADEIARAISLGMDIDLAFTVIGNEPLVLRESLLSEYMEIGRKISDTSFDLYGGLFGPYCVETIITEDLQIYAFEVSARIVAGTNVFPEGSPYSVYYYKEPMSAGRRIARELKLAAKNKKLTQVLY
ncbi:5-formaminoimidazole-4-carboxamide-1-(beta)-D-ribofuranosyl 5'-monophosphate synthetase [Candidatus Bilamarchaeum dharawalense]|uniref:5-formaminoimidazole-4-carboxamide-1-(Beta)-D-rib ofuranosyl 5'-monophosphate synthetase n=1 Tax=Candidatus Bilamarchaeum dharawalense TaxID=2885759 RepID=A0A5E4LU35_9ARCH|nr:5-formaminoimidazole-4-carboxamide-1-(beta)-D-ribofuranosyl 5'-monophosphate synthetase [Candidatus Bilamarchaeum dharawalense]